MLTATIQGRVWQDLDADRLPDPSEAYLSDVEVRLLTMDGLVVDTTMTSEIDLNQSGTIDPVTETGWYQFHSVEAGTYQIQLGGVADFSLTSPQHTDLFVYAEEFDQAQAIPHASRNSVFVNGHDGIAEVHFLSRTVLNRYQVDSESATIELSPDQKTLAVATADEANIRVTFFDLETGTQSTQQLPGPSRQFGVANMLWLEDNRILFHTQVSETDSEVLAYDKATGQSETLLRSQPLQLDVADDHQRAIFYRPHSTDPVWLYESETSQIRELPFLHAESVSQFALNSDGTAVMQSGDDSAVFSIDGNQLYTTTATPIDFSPISGDLVAYGDVTLQRYKAMTGEFQTFQKTSLRPGSSRLEVMNGREYRVLDVRGGVQIEPLWPEQPQTLVVDAVAGRTVIAPAFGIKAKHIQVKTADRHGWRISEGGQNWRIYEVQISHQPDEDLVINVTVDQPNQFHYSTDPLTFTQDNWRTPQFVQLIALEDLRVEGNQNYEVTFSVSSPGGDQAEDWLSKTVSLPVEDNDRLIEGHVSLRNGYRLEQTVDGQQFRINLHDLNGELLQTTITQTGDRNDDGRVSEDEFQYFEFPVWEEGHYLLSIEGAALTGSSFGEFSDWATHHTQAFFHPETSEAIFANPQMIGPYNTTHLAISGASWPNRIEPEIRFPGSIAALGIDRETMVTAERDGYSSRYRVRVSQLDGTLLSNRQVQLPTDDHRLTRLVPVSSDVVWLFTHNSLGSREIYTASLNDSGPIRHVITDLAGADFVAVSKEGMLLINGMVDGVERPVVVDPFLRQIVATGPYGYVATAISDNSDFVIATDKTGQTTLFDGDFEPVAPLGRAFGGAAFDQHGMLHFFDATHQQKHVLDLHSMEQQEHFAEPLILPDRLQYWQIAPDRTGLLAFLGDEHRYVPLQHKFPTQLYRMIKVDTFSSIVKATLSPAQSLTTSPFNRSVPEGATRHIRIALPARPADDVRVSASVQFPVDSDSPIIIADQTPITFTPEDWYEPQVVSFSVAEDQIENPYPQGELNLKVEYFSDGMVEKTEVETVYFAVLDNDVIDRDEINPDQQSVVEVQAATVEGQIASTTVSWQTSIPAEAYELQVVRVGAVPEVVVSRTYWANETTADLVLPNGRYRAWVRAVLPREIQSVSAIERVSPYDHTSAWAPSKVFLHRTAPDGLQVETTESGQAFISWSEVEGATGYRVFIRDQADASAAPVIDEIVSSAEAMFQVPPQMVPYSVWVQSIHDGVHSKWSSPVRMSFRPAIQQKHQLAPDGRPLFAWTPVKGATQYDVSVRRRHAWGEAADVYRVEGTSFQLSEPLPEGEYEWWVRAVSQPGTFVPASYSAFISVSTLSFLNLNEIDLRDDAPVLKWFPTERASHSRVYLRPVSDGQIIDLRNIVGTEAQMPPLPAGKYQAWVQSTFEDGSAHWGQQTTLEIKAPPLTIVVSNLVVNSSSENVELVWDPSEPAARYDVILTTNQGSRIFRDWDASSLTVNDLPEGVWSWHVRVTNESGQHGPWQAGADFNTGARAILVAPKSFAGFGPVELGWLVNAEAKRIQLQIDNLSTGQKKVVREDELTGTSYTIEEGLGRGIYRAWVRAILTDGTMADWSRWHDFTVF